MTSCVVRGIPLPRVPLTSYRLDGQIAAVQMLSRIMAQGREGDAVALFQEAIATVLDLADDGDIDEAREQLKGLARILGPAIQDGLIARRRGPDLRDAVEGRRDGIEPG